jgi:hypothetical protein
MALTLLISATVMYSVGSFSLSDAISAPGTLSKITSFQCSLFQNICAIMTGELYSEENNAGYLSYLLA